MIKVQTEDFDLLAENLKLRQSTSLNEVTKEDKQVGAIVTFTGIVRDFTQSVKNVNPEADFYLEHYPGMTEKVLQEIEEEAHQRWNINSRNVIHRVGKLKPSDNIVFVGVSSRHRKEAFQACEFIIDLLKTQAPFWKKEGNSWVSADEADQTKSLNWASSKAPITNNPNQDNLTQDASFQNPPHQNSPKNTA